MKTYSVANANYIVSGMFSLNSQLAIDAVESKRDVYFSLSYFDVLPKERVTESIAVRLGSYPRGYKLHSSHAKEKYLVVLERRWTWRQWVRFMVRSKSSPFFLVDVGCCWADYYPHSFLCKGRLEGIKGGFRGFKAFLGVQVGRKVEEIFNCFCKTGFRKRSFMAV